MSTAREAAGKAWYLPAVQSLPAVTHLYFDILTTTATFSEDILLAALDELVAGSRS